MVATDAVAYGQVAEPEQSKRYLTGLRRQIEECHSTNTVPCSIEEMSPLFPPRAQRVGVRRAQVTTDYDEDFEGTKWCETWYPSHRDDCIAFLGTKDGKLLAFEETLDDVALTELCCGNHKPTCSFLAPVRGVLMLDPAESTHQLPLFYWGGEEQGIASVAELVENVRSYSFEVFKGPASSFRRRMAKMAEESQDAETRSRECELAERSREPAWLMTPEVFEE